LPPAHCIVNPNQPGCPFPDKHIAGVGVMFYVLLALRAELRSRGHSAAQSYKLAALLDLVALGTVADVVRLDHLNRILVGRGWPGCAAEKCTRACARFLRQPDAIRPVRAPTIWGSLLGPRLNAAGRLADMALGIRCLITMIRSTPPSTRRNSTGSTASAAHRIRHERRRGIAGR
jgi:single-stranded-DNA-specific exonuclease